MQFPSRTLEGSGKHSPYLLPATGQATGTAVLRGQHKNLVFIPGRHAASRRRRGPSERGILVCQERRES